MKQNPPKQVIVERMTENLTNIATKEAFKNKILRKIKRKVELRLEISKSFAMMEYWRKKKSLSENMEQSLNNQIQLFCKDDISVTEIPKEQSDDISVTEKQEEPKELSEEENNPMEESVILSSRLRNRTGSIKYNDDGSGSSQPNSQGSNISGAHEWETPPKVKTPFRVFGTKTLTNTAETLDRFKIPPNQATCLLNAFQIDVGFVGTSNEERLLDPNKLVRDREKVRKEKLEEQMGKVVSGLGIDGRKDQTLTQEVLKNQEGDQIFARNVKKKTDNISVLSTPGNEFIGHFVPESGTGRHNKDALIEFLEHRGIIFRLTLEFLNVDGTPTNTGHTEGLIAQLEEELGRPLQWSVCFLHHLDRPWLHLLLKLDGRSLGPEAFSGPIGKLITTDVHLLPVIKYEPIPVAEVMQCFFSKKIINIK